MSVISGKISEEKISIRYSDLDFDKSLKPFSLLNFFQDIASDNAEKYGFGYSKIYPKSLMWVLIKYRIEFNEYPADINDLILKTEPRGYNRAFAYRNFELRDGDKVLTKASSMWSLVDINTMKMVNVDSVIDSETFPKFEPNETDLSFNKIPALSKIDYQKEFEVRYNDVDVNKHANNGNYIVWALEPLPFEFRACHSLKAIDMMYKKEIRYGEKFTSEVQILEDNSTLHILKHNETDLCHLHCFWQSK